MLNGEESVFVQNPVASGVRTLLRWTLPTGWAVQQATLILGRPVNSTSVTLKKGGENNE